MKIDRNSWHCRVYLWWYENKYHQSNEKQFSNLCPYMRAVMFWAPLRAVFGTWIKIRKIPIDVITIPLLLYCGPKLLGYVNYDMKAFFWSTYGVIGSVIAVIFTIRGLYWVFSPEEADITKPLRKSEFSQLLKEYLRSFHDRICPEVDWK